MITNASTNENTIETAVNSKPITSGPVTLEGHDVIIVSRREWVVEWLARRGITAEVKPAVTVDDIRGKYVIGALPAHLAQYAECMFSVDYTLPTEAYERHSKRPTADDLEKWGAKLFAYKVVPMNLIQNGIPEYDNLAAA
jgi:hypothetical protein